MDRRQDLQKFYELLDRLADRVGGTRTLAECHGRMDWPNRGIYFFFEHGETRTDSGEGPRVVRVGTHALTSTSRTTLWGRLAQHRGIERTGGGNHRGSIFRLIVGSAIKGRDGNEDPASWGIGADPGSAAKKLGSSRDGIHAAEAELEQRVSRYIRNMPFLWLAIDDPPGRDSLRAKIEQNSIALLSNFQRPNLDAPSCEWLGNHSDRHRVCQSGLWNSNHVDETYCPEFLIDFERLIEASDASF